MAFPSHLPDSVKEALDRAESINSPVTTIIKVVKVFNRDTNQPEWRITESISYNVLKITRSKD